MNAVFLLCAMLLGQKPAEEPAAARLAPFVAQCRQAHQARLDAAEQRLQAAPAEARQQLTVELDRLRRSKPLALPIAVPPSPHELGRLAAPVQLLEVVDRENAIVRAWYRDDEGLAGPIAPDEQEETFVDLWLRGVDLSAMKAGSWIRVEQVWQQLGSQAFDTTCGGRSVPLLQAMELDELAAPAPPSEVARP